MALESIEYQLFNKAIELTQQMIHSLEMEQESYQDVTRLLLERGSIYKELDNYIKTLDRTKISDKDIIKQRYDELMQLDHDFRSLLKVQSDRLRAKTSIAKKDQMAHRSYSKPKSPKESMFFSSKLEG
ncbi:hypothetical protein EP331_14980 [bacterium]|nr:MAG: hypothetical protein EP331_14980 [bacterium]